MSRWEGKYVIGLTGNIAVGKSYVRQMLQHLGAYPIDADQLSHQVMAPGAPAYKPVVETFGRFVVDPDGRINRGRLGAVAFAVPEALTTLESIIHPFVRQAINILITRAKQPIIVVEAIKLVESDLADAMDSIWVVNATKESQLRRLLDKRKMSLDEAQKRLNAQRPQEEKIMRANVIIMNDGSPEDTWRQVQTAFENIQGLIAPPPPQAPAPTVPQSPAPLVKPLSGSPAQPTAAQPSPAPVRPQTPAPAAPGTGQLVTGRLNPAALDAVVQPSASSGVSSAVDPKTQIAIKRGMPGNAEAIATFISRVSSRQVGRMDIMLAFGQKSFLLAYGKSDSLVAVVGWQVENLITRVDEFYTMPEIPKGEVIGDLITAVEDASKELQSEVSFIVLPRSIGADIGPSLLRRGYKPLKLDEIRFPAWREAAQDMITIPNADVLIKQLRADRVMKPI